MKSIFLLGLVFFAGPSEASNSVSPEGLKAICSSSYTVKATNFDSTIYESSEYSDDLDCESDARGLRIMFNAARIAGKQISFEKNSGFPLRDFSTVGLIVLPAAKLSAGCTFDRMVLIKISATEIFESADHGSDGACQADAKKVALQLAVAGVAGQLVKFPQKIHSKCDLCVVGSTD